MKPIARIHSGFSQKFGIPRQSGMIEALKAQIIFEKEYRNCDAVRGLEGFSHIWLIWEFSMAKQEKWSPTVRPPRLGGNQRLGVFATRSPFRPNPIGLSAVKLERIETDVEFGPVLYVSGADILDGTPIYDIKPYLPYSDSYPDATAGFAGEIQKRQLIIDDSEGWLSKLPEVIRQAFEGILRNDPRPAYQDSDDRIYGVTYAGYDVKFTVSDGILYIKEWIKD